MMTKILPCPRVHLDLNDNLQQVKNSFDGIRSIPLRQAWRENPEPDFRPARVNCGWDDQALWIYAELDDEDIGNPVQENHRPAFQYGDVFEIFFRPNTCDTYYELHITPHNHIFQLRIPSSETFYEQRNTGINPDWVIFDPFFSHRAEIQPEHHQWRVLAQVEFAKLGLKSPVQPGTEWTISFSRYDYSHNRDSPVLSSSSNHVKIDFHRQEEWNTLRFE